MPALTCRTGRTTLSCMSKSQVYSWRLDERLKVALEEAARDGGTSVSGLLEEIVRSWLAERSTDPEDAERQARIRAEAMRHVGSIEGNDPDRAAEASTRVREIVKRRRAG